MIFVWKKEITEAQKEILKEQWKKRGMLFRENSNGMLFVVKGDFSHAEREYFSSEMEFSSSYPLVSRQFQKEDLELKVNGHSFGRDSFTMIAGPCAVESEKQVMEIARFLSSKGLYFMRGGAYKPRTSPYAFQGLEEKGLEDLQKAKDETGLLIVSECTSVSHLEECLQHVDIIQIGARNMQNFELLKAVGHTNKPVLLKRGMSNTIEEWLLSAEYIVSEGNPNVILCERGIRTFEQEMRNTLDLSAVALVKQKTYLPVIVDPSHATGRADLVLPMSYASLAAGADGLLIELHPHPEQAQCDGRQSLSFEEFDELMQHLSSMVSLFGKKL